MAPRKRAAAPHAPRKTLLEWIDHDDGDTTRQTQPECSEQDEKLHARTFVTNAGRWIAPGDSLQPPAGLRLAPLG